MLGDQPADDAVDVDHRDLDSRAGSRDALKRLAMRAGPDAGGHHLPGVRDHLPELVHDVGEHGVDRLDDAAELLARPGWWRGPEIADDVGRQHLGRLIEAMRIHQLVVTKHEILLGLGHGRPVYIRRLDTRYPPGDGLLRRAMQTDAKTPNIGAACSGTTGRNRGSPSSSRWPS